MAISLHPQPYPFTSTENKVPKSLFVDASNRTRLHAHLRTTSMSARPKSPPTCTLSLANGSSAPGISMDTLPIPIPFPAPVSFPCNGPDTDGDTGSCGDESPQPWRRPRARTSHVETPRRVQPTPLKAVRLAKQASSTPRATPKRLASASTSGSASAAAADLRFAALIERSITQRLRERPATLESDSAAQMELFDRQDALLAGRLRSKVAGRRARPPSPTGIGIAMAPPVCAPSVLFAGSAGMPASSSPPPTSPRPQGQPLRFVPAPATRARSGSRGSTGSGGTTLGMPALVASLMLRRHEGGRPGSPSAFARRRVEHSLPPSPLRPAAAVVPVITISS